MGLVTPLGSGHAEVARALFQGTNRGLVARDDLLPGRTGPSLFVAAVSR